MKLVKTDRKLEIHISERDQLIEIMISQTGMSFELANSIVNFAYSTTNLKHKRAKDIKRDKIFACRSFFSIIKKEVDQITVAGVNDWHQWMFDKGNIKKRLDPNQQNKGLEEMTIYTRLSHLSAYFEWLRKVPEFGHFIKVNPVRLAMPKPPEKYNSSKSKSLTDEELYILWNYLEKLAEDENNRTAIRDYAIFRIFMVTGMRREEVIDLSAGDIKFTDDSLNIHARFKGGTKDYRSDNDCCGAKIFKNYGTFQDHRQREPGIVDQI